jgi:hypothetical protein
MEPVVGIFPSPASARHAIPDLVRLGFRADQIELLLPGTDADEAPTDEAEQPGMGQAVGGVVGAAAGASAGFGLGAATASLLLPGIGAVTAIGIAAAALLGAAGAAGGVAAGSALEGESRQGVPKDEIYLYESALSQGKGVLFVLVASGDEDERARRALTAAGAESLDAARENWWVGIRDLPNGTAASTPEVHGETAYRRGFLAAFEPDLNGKSYRDARSALRRRAGDVVLSEAFERGYLRGWAVANARDREKSLVERP